MKFRINRAQYRIISRAYQAYCNTDDEVLYDFISEWLLGEHNIKYETDINGYEIFRWVECDIKDWTLFLLRHS